MLNFNSTIKQKKKYSDIKIEEIEPIIKINLRSKKREFSKKIGKILSILPPTEANTSSGNEDYNLLWLSPDEWLVYSNNKKQSLKEQIDMEDKLFDEISKLNQGAVTNVSDHWVMINLKVTKFMIYYQKVVLLILMNLKEKKAL